MYNYNIAALALAILYMIYHYSFVYYVGLEKKKISDMEEKKLQQTARDKNKNKIYIVL